MTPLRELTEDEVEARLELVRARFATIGSRPGTRVEWGGYCISVYDDLTVDVLTGETRPMCWVDEAAADKIVAAAADPQVSDVDVLALVL